jgi:hypothetical protein
MREACVLGKGFVTGCDTRADGGISWDSAPQTGTRIRLFRLHQNMAQRGILDHYALACRPCESKRIQCSMTAFSATLEPNRYRNILRI